jgi:predicted MFS family arabinose efflux permease
MILFCLFAFSLFSSVVPLVTLRTVELLGKYQHHANCGVQYFAMGIAYCIGGSLAGYIFDVTGGSFRAVFLACAAFFFFSFVFDELAFGKYSIIFSSINKLY